MAYKIPQQMKLSYAEALSISQQAYQQVQVTPTYRLGQGITNLLPKELWEETNQTDLDFFYWLDNEKVLNTFYSEYVDPCKECFGGEG